MDEMTTQDMLRLAAEGLINAGGRVLLDNTGPSDRFGYLIIQMPTGQQFILRGEED